MSTKFCFKVDKLIRDKVPEIMHNDGTNIHAMVMDDIEYANALKKKLIEEAEEVFMAENATELKEELADVLEVILSIAKQNNLTFDDIINAAEYKRINKGGFDKKFYSPFVEIAAGNPRLEYYLKRPNKYPQIKK